MEFFFGFCFGWALAWAWAHSVLPEEEAVAGEAPVVGIEMAGAAVLAAGLFWLSWNLPVRFGYLLAGSAVLYLLTKYRWAAKHVACTVTFTAVALDLARYWSREYKYGPEAPAYALAIVASVIFGWYVVRWSGDTRRVLELLMWACVVDATAKFAINPKGIISVVDHVCIGFILMGVAVSWMLRSTQPPIAATRSPASLPPAVV